MFFSLPDHFSTKLWTHSYFTEVNENTKNIIPLRRLLQSKTSLSLNLFPDYEPEVLHVVEQFYVSVKRDNLFFSPARTLEMVQLFSQHTLFLHNNASWKQRLQSLCLCTITFTLFCSYSLLSLFPWPEGNNPDIPLQHLPCSSPCIF